MIERNIIVERGKPLFIQLNGDTARELRKDLYDRLHGFCPVLQIPIPFEQIVLDHKHKRKTDPIGPNGGGLVRGPLDFRVNSLEGIFLKKFKKSGLLGLIKYSDLLRGIAEYVDNPICPQYYIYPSEKPPADKLSKRDFDLICKWYRFAYPKRKKQPQYPPSGIKIKRVSVPGKSGKVERRAYKAKLSPKWIKMLDQAIKAKKKGLIK